MGPYPGAELVAEGQRAPTNAVTIWASPQQVWPWLVQMGWDRGGWYSWDRLDNAGRPSATEVHPEWQNVAVGDQLSFWALGRRLDAYRIGVLDPDRFLGLYGYSDLRGRWLDPEEPRPTAYMEAIWGFLLNELPDGRTRLVVSGYQTFRPRWIERLAADWMLLPVSWVMQSRMLVVLERASSGRLTPKRTCPRVQGGLAPGWGPACHHRSDLAERAESVVADRRADQTPAPDRSIAGPI